MRSPAHLLSQEFGTTIYYSATRTSYVRMSDGSLLGHTVDEARRTLNSTSTPVSLPASCDKTDVDSPAVAVNGGGASFRRVNSDNDLSPQSVTKRILDKSREGCDGALLIPEDQDHAASEQNMAPSRCKYCGKACVNDACDDCARQEPPHSPDVNDHMPLRELGDEE